MIIEAEYLSKRFKRVDAVDRLNLSVPEGAAFALIGANGAGKTTVLRMMVNLLRPDSGNVRVLGVDSRLLTPNDFTRIGYVSENQQLPEQLSVEQFLDYLRAIYSNWDVALEKELVGFFDLPRNQYIGKLSHGTRMKMKLVAALSFRPKVLILDEPLSGLDPLVRDEVMAGLLRQAEATTMVMSSQEVSEIESWVSHVAFMANGKLILQESIESLTARFREVSVVLTANAANPPSPKHWIGVQMSGLSLRFVETAFSDDDQSQGEIRTLFGAFAHFESRPMSLRDISKALLRALRKESNS